MIARVLHPNFPCGRTLLAQALLCLTVVAALGGASRPSSAMAGLGGQSEIAGPWSEPDDADLRELRAARRANSRELARLTEKSGQPALFGLLVVPVEFADTRFEGGWTPQKSLSPILDGGGPSTLTNYFDVASGGQFEVRVTLTPVVRLQKNRQDYSILGSTNAERSRMMAAEALETVRDWGLEFRLLDMDGPDGVAGSGDDDGQVDGVLFLHAGVGLENDLETGLIPAHQYFLAEPVVSDGIGAAFYAVASHSSGLGIWAHETAHLLGLEDRYDPRLGTSGGSEIQSLGGLGRFSLMASGAWGTGQGRQPSLPDAYSCLQLGWVKVRDLDTRGVERQSLRPGLETGEVGRLWTNGEVGDEFFLVETRNPAATAPFDAAVPGQQLLVYHVDETLVDGVLIPDSGWQFHLPVRFVEADGNDGLAAGLDDGGWPDVFPGSEGITEFGPLTMPGSDGYSEPSGVEFSGIRTEPDGVSFFSRSIYGFAVDCELLWTAGEPSELGLVIRERGEPFPDLRASLRAEGTETWGTFLDGSRIEDFDLVESAPGLWTPAAPVYWSADLQRPAGAVTRFTIRLSAPDWTSDGLERRWPWTGGGQALDFAALWPGEWVARRPGGLQKTGWFRWDAAPWLTANEKPVLACVDTIFPDSSQWPNVRYNNYGYATLTSGPLDPALRGVRLVHAIEGDLLSGAVAQDGGQVVWVAADGSEVPVEPVDGWEAEVHGQVYSPLAGQGVLVGTKPFLRDGLPVWHTDVFAVPDAEAYPDKAAGPWRLRLVFASDGTGYYHGWFIASIEPLYEAIPSSAFPVEWNSGLSWQRPSGLPESGHFQVEEFLGPELEWAVVTETSQFPDPLDGTYRLPEAEILAGLSEQGRQRSLVRIVGTSDWGSLASRPLVIFPDGGPGEPSVLGVPWPNPSSDGLVRFLAGIPEGQTARAIVYDLRGRRIRTWDLPSGNHFLLWEGTDSADRPVASGTYVLRLEGSDPVISRKVVLLH